MSCELHACSPWGWDCFFFSFFFANNHFALNQVSSQVELWSDVSTPASVCSFSNPPSSQIREWISLNNPLQAALQVAPFSYPTFLCLHSTFMESWVEALCEQPASLAITLCGRACVWRVSMTVSGCFSQFSSPPPWCCSPLSQNPITSSSSADLGGTQKLFRATLFPPYSNFLRHWTFRWEGGFSDLYPIIIYQNVFNESRLYLSPSMSNCTQHNM